VGQLRSRRKKKRRRRRRKALLVKLHLQNPTPKLLLPREGNQTPKLQLAASNSKLRSLKMKKTISKFKLQSLNLIESSTYMSTCFFKEQKTPRMP
jgi:hypothetical protein